MAIMGENNKARRFSGQQEEDERADRLSDLPDNLIHQIMSFLDTKTAVQTCVLSKRWDHLWVSLPDLDFGIHWDTYSSFRKFVLRVLSARADCNGGKFKINCRIVFDDYLLQKIIDYVVSHNVEHLELCPGDETTYCFLYPLTMCNSLKTLKLSDFFLGDLHQSFGFGFKMLTSLDLSCCLFCYTSDPFASFLNLKNLRLQSCAFSDRLRVPKISGLQLLELKIEYLPIKVEILAPRLTSFSLKGRCASARRFSALDLPSVSYAEIYFEEEYRSTRKQDVIVDALVIKQNFINFFRGLYNAQVLALSSTIIKDMDYVLGFVKQHPSPFKRLMSLKVECKGNLIVIPAHVRTYLLGDDPYEETIHEEGGTDAETVVYVEFQKVLRLMFSQKRL